MPPLMSTAEVPDDCLTFLVRSRDKDTSHSPPLVERGSWSGRASDCHSGARGPGFDPHERRVGFEPRTGHMWDKSSSACMCVRCFFLEYSYFRPTY